MLRPNSCQRPSRSRRTCARSKAARRGGTARIRRWVHGSENTMIVIAADLWTAIRKYVQDRARRDSSMLEGVPGADLRLEPDG